MTKKDFVLAVTEQLSTNPGSVLKGHGMRPEVLAKIAGRPDIIAKLANILWTTNYAKKGAAGLKKTDKFVIKGYRNFNDFNARGREDVAAFTEGLSPEDAAKFSEEESVVTILALASDEPSETMEEQIVTGQSEYLPFSKAVRSEYKSAVAFYVVVMVADSAIRTGAIKASKARRPKLTPNIIKSRLVRKANKKLARVAKNEENLMGQKFGAQHAMNQYSYIKGALGGDIDGSFASGAASMEEYNAMLKAAFKSSNAADKKFAKLYLEVKNDKIMAKKVLSRITNSELVAALSTPPPTDPNNIVNSRKQELRKRLKQLSLKNENLMLQLAMHPPKNLEISIKATMSRNNKEIAAIRAKLGTYKNMSNLAFQNKTRAYADVIANLESNLKKGLDIKESLDAAIAKVDASNAEKEVIKQQVMVQVAQGSSIQNAIQTTLDGTQNDVFDATDLIDRL